MPDQLFTDPTSTVIDDKYGNLMGAQIADDGQWRFPHNTEVPEKFEKAIVAFEDKYFFSHPGINPGALGRAIYQNVKEQRVVSGGSTITMQVVRLARKGQGRTLREKAIEAIWATRMELKYTKQEILAMYASNAPFGGNVVGLDAAAWRYFGRAPDNLSWAEMATLAVLPNAPALIHPGRNRDALIAKRNRLLDRLELAGDIDATTCELSKLEPIPDDPYRLPQEAPHLLVRAFNEHKGERIQTTIDPHLQKQVSEMAMRHSLHMKDNGVHNVAVLVLDVNTGNVLSYVGNNPEAGEEHGESVDIIMAPRSTGSLLKPYLFASMLHHGELLPTTLVPDIPLQFSGYSPKNYSLSYDGAVPAKRALARSLNIPSVKMLQNHGLQKFHFLLKQMGMTTVNRSSEDYGLSLILGGGEGRLWEMAGIFASWSRTLNHFNEHNGKYYSTDFRMPSYQESEHELKWEDMDEEPPILSASSIWLTYQAMQEVNRPGSEGNWQEFSSSERVAWKTGTSFGFRDAWAIGTTPDHVVAVWVGNADGEGRPVLTGLGAAAPLLFNVFGVLPSGDWFDKPVKEMKQISVCKHSGYLATHDCELADTIWASKSGQRVAPCPYHRTVHLDKEENYQVSSDCYVVKDIVHKSWFVLPPVQEYYYKQKHPTYQPLPPIDERCKSAEGLASMEFIYPKQVATLAIPVDLSGESSKVVFKVAHRKENTTIYWHLDETYLGTTKSIHSKEIFAEEGWHTLSLVDEHGERISRRFKVAAKG